MSADSSGLQSRPFSFSGSGSEYFRIWIVNLALTILTVGIYSAWAKVRRLKYFYQNTRLADGGFDFHGSPVAILKGRIIAVILLLAYNFSGLISPTASLVTFGLLLLVLPWLIVKSLRFKLIVSCGNSSISVLSTTSIPAKYRMISSRQVSIRIFDATS